MKSARIPLLAVLLVWLVALPGGCGGDQPVNSPYPAADAGRPIYYSYFTVVPKTFDPAQSYSGGEYKVLGLIVEPPLQYHFLRRPFRHALIPNTAAAMPVSRFRLQSRIAARVLRGGSDAPGEPVDLRLDTGTRGGIQPGATSGLTIRLDLPPGEPDAQPLPVPLTVLEADDYTAVARIDRPRLLATLRARGEDGTALADTLNRTAIDVPAGALATAQDGSDEADEVGVRQFVQSREQHAVREQQVAAWMTAVAASELDPTGPAPTSAASPVLPHWFAAPAAWPDVTVILPTGWAAPASGDRLTTADGTMVMLGEQPYDPLVNERQAHPDWPDRAGAVQAALADTIADLPGAPAVVGTLDVAPAGGDMPGRVLTVAADGAGTGAVLGRIAGRNRHLLATARDVPLAQLDAVADGLAAVLGSIASTRYEPGYADAEVTVEVQIRRDIYYAPHPCFAREWTADGPGRYRYHPGFENASVASALRRLHALLVRGGNPPVGAIEDLVAELAVHGVVVEPEPTAVERALTAHGRWMTPGDMADRYRLSDFDTTRAVGVELDAPAPVTDFPPLLDRRVELVSGEQPAILWYGRMLRRDRDDLLALMPGDTGWEQIVHTLWVESRRVDTRELTAADYVRQIRRLASPQTNCPIFEMLSNYIRGFDDYRTALEQQLNAERARRQAAQGIAYSQETDERDNPIRLDLFADDLHGVELVDSHTFRIRLQRPWPQLRYWLAMPFFCPLPWEVESFVAQGPMAQNDVSLTSMPVGTGPFRMETFKRTQEVRLVRNENYRRDFYPTMFDPVYDDLNMAELLLEVGPTAAGDYGDAGTPLPMVEGVVRKYEKEPVPRWHKFLQGYYDRSKIVESVFEGAVAIGASGLTVDSELGARGIRITRAPEPSIWFHAFNMLDPVWGGTTPEEALSEQKCKLRQAVSIALDSEALNDIFVNGRYSPAMGPIPPGILGNGGPDDLNPYVYERDPDTGRAVRRSLAYARQLLIDAGYPGGRTPTGEQLVLHFDTTVTSPAGQSRLAWMRKQLDQIGIRMEVRASDFARLKDKIEDGKHVFFGMRWSADYPDPENFLFLFYGPNHATRLPGDPRSGENSANYSNPEYDRLFRMIETMPDDTDTRDLSAYRATGRIVSQANGVPDRAEIIDEMVEILRHDAPWVFSLYYVTLTLSHQWVHNAQPNEMAHNVLKYRRIDAADRQAWRRAHNEPVLWPLALLAAMVLAAVVPAMVMWRRRQVGV